MARSPSQGPPPTGRTHNRLSSIGDDNWDDEGSSPNHEARASRASKQMRCFQGDNAMERNQSSRYVQMFSQPISIFEYFLSDTSCLFGCPVKERTMSWTHQNRTMMKVHPTPTKGRGYCLRRVSVLMNITTNRTWKTPGAIVIGDPNHVQRHP